MENAKNVESATGGYTTRSNRFPPEQPRHVKFCQLVITHLFRDPPREGGWRNLRPEKSCFLELMGNTEIRACVRTCFISRDFEILYPNEKINDFFEQLHKWLEGFEQRLELPPVEVEKPKKKQKGFRRKMKMTDSMSFFLKAAQSSFTDVSKCRYLRGKNATDIDMSQVTKTEKENLALNRKILQNTEESDEDEKEEVLPKRMMTRDMRRTSEIISSLQIKIDPIV
ncbi:unnamed protein product [Oikopleura dioica]|uniref:Uncharacterized protein n=1 Tax=Oikopleura dioica TaxID=34765 RepID=E4XC19_OIKDI|nr:unnamed protein product [Oikopleura dioica]